MTEAEFRGWLDYHEELFPAFASWMGRLDSGKRSIMLDTWMQALRPVSLQAARISSDRIKAGAIPVPTRYDKLPEAIRQDTKPVNPVAAKDCICEGTGTVDVISNGRFLGRDRWYPEIRFNASRHVITVACLCPKGQWINACRERTPPPGERPLILPVYDPGTMRLYKEFMGKLLKNERADRELQAAGKQPCHVAQMSAMPNGDLDSYNPDQYASKLYPVKAETPPEAATETSQFAAPRESENSLFDDTVLT